MLEDSEPHLSYLLWAQDFDSLYFLGAKISKHAAYYAAGVEIIGRVLWLTRGGICHNNGTHSTDLGVVGPLLILKRGQKYSKTISFSESALIYSK